MSETPSSRSLIGVAVAVGGNVLISVALNCQKLAHLRLNGQNPHEQHSKRDEVEDEQSIDEEDQGQDPDLGQEDDGDRGRLSNGYGSTDVRVNMGGAGSTNWPGGTYGIKAPNGAPGDADGADDDTQAGSDDGSDHGPSTRFLRSKLWWLGMGLMIVGEGGNFLSYGFAPASLVAPLGAVALLSNVLISPLLLHERFRAADFGGIFLAILGAVTVVFSSKQNDARLGPNALREAIKRTEFVAYVCIAVICALLLAFASHTRVGDRWVLVDVGVCAIFGGFTVLSTKGLSSLLSAGNPFDIIRYWITYPLAIVLAGTAVIQITYLNRALQRFDSREVIPTQFVLFTLSAIIGSAVLYRDFENVDAHRLLNFFFGCLMTFAGVILLTRGGASQEKSRKGRSSRPGHRITSSGSSQEDRDSSATAESGEEEAHLSEDADTLGPSTPKRTRRARPTPGTATTTGSVPLAQSASPLAALRTPRMSLIGLATSPRLGGGLLTPSAGSERLSVGPAGLSAGHYLLLAASPPVAIPEDRLRPGLRAPGSYSRTRSLSQPPTPRRRRAAVAGAGTNRRGDGSPARRRGADADLEAGQGMLGHGRSDDDSGIESDMEGRGDTDQSGGASVPNESTPLVSSSAPQAGRRNGARTRDSAQTSAR